MFFVKDRYVVGMAALRLFSGMLEFSAAVLMLKLNRVDCAVKINSLLAFIGPLVFVFATIIGLAGLKSDLSACKIAVIGIGVLMIFIGLSR